MLGLPGKGEYLPYQFRPAGGCREYPVYTVHTLAPRGEIISNHLREPDDGCQDVVEVMGDAASQGTYGFHLLRVPELLFDLFAHLHLTLKRFIGFA